MKDLFRYVLLLAMVLSALSCDDNSNRPTEKESGKIDTSSEDQRIFKKLSPAESGVTFSNDLSETPTYNYFKFQYAFNGAGVAIGDINNDGLPDVYFTGNQVQDALYVNEGNLKFRDITASSGIENEGGFNFGVTMVDIDQDGDQDIYVCRSGHKELKEERANLLFINNGDLTFTESAKKYGIADIGHSIQSAFFDYDKDGDLDMYLTNHPVAFGQNLKERLDAMKNPEYTVSDRLYRNNGDQTFTDVTREAGILNYGHGLGLLIWDINEDGWDDIYVANDYQSTDYVYINNQDGTFTDQMKDYFPHIPYYAMGIDVADINNDALLDINVVEMLPENYKRLLMNLSDLSEKNYYVFREVGFHHQYLRNGLSINTGMGRFSDVALMAQVDATDWSWSTLIADYDNDGLQDIFITNGYMRDVQDKDYIKRAKMIKQAGERLDAERFNEIIKSVKLRNYLYKNKGDLQFENVAKNVGLEDRTFTSGAAYADLDLDGDLDLITSNNNLQLEPDPCFVYENLSSDGQNFLTFHLEGEQGNLDGLGTRILIEVGGEKMIRVARRTRGFHSAVARPIHFGIGDRGKVDRVTVIWPDRTFQILSNVSGGSILTLKKSDASGEYATPEPETRFKTYEAQGLSFKHQDLVLNEFDIQPQLPYRLAMQGPDAAIADVDGNGEEDIFFTNSKNNSDELYLQFNGRFSKKEGPWSDYSEEEHVVATFADIDGDGDQDLYVGSGGVEFGSKKEELIDKIFINDGNGNFTYDAARIPTLMSSTSVVEFGDMDADGDLDIFVGSRAVPHKYGEYPPSYYLRNEEGKFISVAPEAAPDILGLGMVSDASWNDLDADGDLDLIVVGEWSSPSLFINEGGHLSLDQDLVPDIKGLWRSVEVEDLDGDGRPEILLGNAGLNIKYNASEEYPLRMYTGDIDHNGKRDIMFAFKQGKHYHPDYSLTVLREQFPFLKSKYPYYEDFAGKSLQQIFGTGLESAQLHEVNELASVVLTYQDGKYVSRNMPTSAQISYINDIVTHDIDNDGDQDVIVAGNELFTPIQTGSSDAGLGYLFMNDGQGNLEEVHSSEAGLRLTDWVKGMDIISIDGQPILIGWRNDLAPLLYSFEQLEN